MFKRLKRRVYQLMKIGIVVGMCIQTGISDDIALALGNYIRENYIAKADMQIGTSGSLVPGSPMSASSGIYTQAYTNPPLRVSLYRTKNVDLDPDNGLVKIWNKIAPGYPDNLQGSIHFIPEEYHSTVINKPFTIAKGNTSSKSLSLIADGNEINNVRGMYGNNTGPVYYDSIMANFDKMKTEWKNYANQYDKSINTWSYILDQIGLGNYDIENRLNQCFNPAGLDFNNAKDWNETQQKEAWGHYLDMLMTLYTVSSDTSKLIWERAVNDFVKNENLTESPISVVIDTEALLSINYQKEFTLVSSIDFVNYYAGVEAAFALNSSAWLTRPESAEFAGDTYRGLLTSIQNSINSSPGFNRISGYTSPTQCQSYGAFCFGEAALQENFLLTSGNNARWVGGNPTGTAYLEMLKFGIPGVTADSYGFLLSPAPKIATTDIPLKLEALPDERIVRTKNIGQPVDLRIYSDLTPDKLGIWENIINNAKVNNLNFEITIQMERTDAPNTGINPSYTPDISTVIKTPEQYLEFITGREDIIFNDTSTDGVQIEGKDRIQFDYTAHITIKCGENEWKGDPTDPASFKHSGEKIGYTSKPEAYAELKNYGAGSNQNGTLSEDWEAMAGVPSTEQLYFAAGGSEFIVDITLEYVKDEIAKRTYDVYYSGVNCEFYTADQHKTQTAPAPVGASSSSLSANSHTGAKPSATWKGKIPNNNKGSKGGVGSVTCEAAPDESDYNEALQQANDWAAAINAWNITHTAGSDGITRNWNQWNATVSASPSPPGSPSASKYHQDCDDEGHCTSVPDPVTCNYAPDGSYTITVTTSIVPHAVCGPCCQHTLPTVHDTWAQTFKYDSMKIVDVHVWKINQGAVDGLNDIIATDIVGADIKKGEPNIFYNIALKNDKDMANQDGKGGATGTSSAGRVRYSVDPKQHDEVIYNMGNRTNKCDGLATTKDGNVSPAGGSGHSEKWATGFIYNAFSPGSSNTGAVTRPSGQQDYPTNQVGFLQNKTDAKDKATTEYNGFLTKRSQMNQATMITDFLILQTSNGDQAVMYFDKDAPAQVTAETEIPQLVITKEEMWDNNNTSAHDWKEDHINVGSYNGNYTAPNSKFRVKNNGNTVKTFFEPDPAGTIKKPTQAKGLMLYEGELNIILEDTNKSYLTGEAEVFWKNELHWVDSNSKLFNGVTDALGTAPYSTSDKVGKLTQFNFNAKNGDTGYIQNASYSKEHDKINDIIIHDPVSVEDTAIISLPDERDQRTGEILGGSAGLMDELNKNTTCSGDPATCDFRHLNCKFFEDVLVADIDFDELTENGNPINNITGNGIILTDGFTVKNGELDARGIRWGVPFKEMGISYNSSFTVRIDADIKTTTTNTTMLFSFYKYDIYLSDNGTKLSFNTGDSLQREIILENPINDGNWHNVVFDMNFNSMEKSRAYIDGVETEYKIHLDSDGKEKDMGINSALVGDYLYVGGWKYDDNYSADFVIDNLKITKLAGSKEHTADCYKLAMMHPSGLNYHTHSADCLQNFGTDYNYTGGSQKVTLDKGKYLIELWGAGSDTSKGGYTKFELDVDQLQDYYLYIGGQGTKPTADIGTGGGYNGGGAGSYAKSNTTLNTGTTINGYYITTRLGSITLSLNQTYQIITHSGCAYSGEFHIRVIGTTSCLCCGHSCSMNVIDTFKTSSTGINPNIYGYGGGGMTHFTTSSNDLLKSENKQVQTVTPSGQFSGTSHYNGKTASSWSDPNNQWSTVKEYVANNNGTVTFESTYYTTDPVCRILVNDVVKVTNDDGGNGYNFRASVNVTKGDKVTVQISSYSTSSGQCDWFCTHPGISEITYQWKETRQFDTSKVLGVAGGAGGASYSGSNSVVGGNGGGTSGTNGTYAGGTQTSGYSNGLGQSATTTSGAAGAGGGWYGGRTGSSSLNSGGGGSGYIKTGLANGKTEVGVNTGNGKARITKLDGVGEVITNILDGKYTNKEIKDILGDKIYTTMMDKNTTLLHTWSNWTTSNMLGFTAGGTASITASGNNLVINSTGNDPMTRVPVDIEAEAVRRIEVTLDNNTASTMAQLFWNNANNVEAENRSVRVNIKANTNGQKVVFNVEDCADWTGTIKNLRFDLVTTNGTVTVSKIEVYGTGIKEAGGNNSQQVWNFEYSGNSKYITLPAGKYKLEVWGAEGGTSGKGGKGGYAYGDLITTSQNTLYIFVGGREGYNGGGTSPHGVEYYGGGATDIRLNGTTLNSRIIVAGGGGGWGGISGSGHGGAGGGLSGEDGAYGYSSRKPGYGGTQTSGGSGGSGISSGGSGSLGQGGSAKGGSKTGGGGGGGGYYGGGAGGTDYSNYNDLDDGDGGGGSAYIGGVAYGGTETGVQSGNGKAKITSLFSPVKITESNANKEVIDRDTLINNIKNNWQTIPYWKGNKDGVENPIWDCHYLPLNTHKCDNLCYEAKILQCSEPHHKNMHYDASNRMCWEACGDDEAHRKFKEEINTADGTFKPGNFINIDYGFEIYFPNLGDFDDGEPYGIGGLTSQRGLGFIDDLDTTKWTRVKRVKFEWNVIYENQLYLANEWITLADRGTYTGIPGEPYDEKNWTNYGTDLYDWIEKDRYTFYAVLANYEAKSAKATFEVEAINCPGPNDNLEKPTNKKRASTFTSLHGGTNETYIDVVGRIGNLVLEDTGDYRYSNLFKTPIDTSADVDNKNRVEYDIANLEAINEPEEVNGGYKLSTSGQGVGISNFQVVPGQYRVEVYGQSLGNGKLYIEDNNGIDWVKSDNVKQSSIGQQLMVYYIDSTVDAFLNIKYLIKDNSYMQIDKVVITQTGDTNEGWVVDGIVRKVDESKQNYYLTWTQDIRGIEISNKTNFINTYGTRTWLDSKTDTDKKQLPLSPEKNNIAILQQDPMLVGYDLYADITTTGNYYANGESELQVIPYYYALDVVSKEIVPLDVYIRADEVYQPVNIYDLVKEKKDDNGKSISAEQQIQDGGIYNYSLVLDWLAESIRRNYTDVEKYQTDDLRVRLSTGYIVQPDDNLGSSTTDGNGGTAPARQLYAPSGNYYSLGWAQFMRQDGHSRTFVGGETTYGVLKNLGGNNEISTDENGRLFNEEGRINDYEWWKSAQRWHIKIGLPSSSVFVRHDVTPDVDTIKEFDNGRYVILCTADIRSVGNTFVLRYDHLDNNGSIKVMMNNGVWSDEIKLPTDIPPVIAVYSMGKTSVVDVDIVGTH